MSISINSLCRTQRRSTNRHHPRPYTCGHQHGRGPQGEERTDLSQIVNGIPQNFFSSAALLLTAGGKVSRGSQASVARADYNHIVGLLG